MTSTYTQPLTSLNKDSNAIAGGKGSSLGEMLNSGIPVPDGFVVTVNAFEHFYDGGISGECQNEILKAFDNLDCEFVAVRSSATCEDSVDNSFAGQFDTFLNTRREYLMIKIRECWNSLNSDRCKEYMLDKKINPKSVKVAVVIQKMIQSQVAGVAFTVNPITNDSNKIMIEAGYGLGEAVVSGQITPDNYLVNKDSKIIIAKNISTQTKGIYRNIDKDSIEQNYWKEIEQKNQNSQKLTDFQILELSELCLKIEQHYEHACDIEWALYQNKIYITQSRPITTVGEYIKLINLDYIMRRDTAHVTNEITAISLLSLYNNLVVQHTVTNYTLIAVKFIDNQFELYVDNNKFKVIRGILKQKILNQEIDLFNIYKLHLESTKKAKNSKTKKEFIDYITQAGKYWMYLWFALSISEDSDISKLSEIIALLEEFRLKDTQWENIDQYILQDDKYSIDSRYKMSIDDYISGSFEIDTSDFKIINYYENLLDFDLDSIQFCLNKDINSNPDKENIFGQIACLGNVIGTVKIIDTKDKLKKVLSQSLGSEFVLVSNMTTPDYVPLMKKSVAIVTDEGGITCHAAIISRELNIPCIIGTKFATQILKDGDLVEVDANNGVVRILERMTSQDFDQIITIKNIIDNNPLEKHWEREYSVLFLSFIEDSQSFWNNPIFGGPYFNLAIFTLNNGITTMYRIKKENEKFYESIGNKMINDSNFAKNIIDEYSKAGDSILSIFEDIEQNKFMITAENIKIISNLYQKITSFQLIMHRIIDFLQTKKVDSKLLDSVIQGRQKYEKVFGSVDEFLVKWLGDKTLTQLTKQELTEFIKTKSKPNNIIERSQKSVFVNIPFVELFFGGIASSILESVKINLDNQNTESNNKVLSGKSVFGEGIIRGSVIVKDNFEDIESIPPNSILVMKSTIPKYNNVYSKMKCIIAEEGGFLSHVSIVCRENKIPCMVGVKNATQVLKDGNLVEINFDTGIINVLEKDKI